MLIDLAAAIDRWGMTPRNVIHVGAHFGQEVDEYRALGVQRIVLMEPQPRCPKKLRKRFRGDANVQIVPCAAGSIESDGGRASMHVVRRNKGQSSSLLKPLTHLVRYPKITFKRRIEVQIRALDRITADVNDRESFDLLNIDVQGYELEVLKGAGETLTHIDTLITEVNCEESYEGGAMIDELDALLTPLGFERVETEWSDSGWGDGLYTRRRSSQELDGGAAEQ